MRLLDLLATAVAPSYVLGATSPRDDDPRLDTMDCQIRCPRSSDPVKVILPALSQKVNASGVAENTLECWQIDFVSISLPGIQNAFRIDWEGGFDAAYQYIFTGPSFMPSHPAPEPSLIVMSNGIGMFFRSRGLLFSANLSSHSGDLRVPSGKCLRVGAGDIFFSVGIDGRQTAWWSEGTVVSDFYFKGGKIPEHSIVPELAVDEDGPMVKQERLEL